MRSTETKFKAVELIVSLVSKLTKIFWSKSAAKKNEKVLMLHTQKEKNADF